MEKTKKGNGDYADDVLPEKSVDLNHQKVHFLSQYSHQSYCSFLTPSCNSQRECISANELINTDQFKESSNDSDTSDIKDSPQKIQKFSTKIAHNPPMLAGSNCLLLNNCFISPLQMQLESQGNNSIADERKNAEVSSHLLGEPSIVLVYSKRVHSMTEKKNQSYQQIMLKTIEQEAPEQQTESDCMSECSPQIIPKFSYRVSMPSNFSKEQSLESIKRVNEHRYQLLMSTANQLLQHEVHREAVISNFISFLNTSYNMAKERPEECAHLLVTLETQFDLLLAIQFKNNYKHILNKKHNQSSNNNNNNSSKDFSISIGSQTFSLKEQEEPGDEGVS